MSLLLNFPTSYELNEVIQDFEAKPEEYIGKTILPDHDSMIQKVRWDERDRDRGMTAPHVMGTDPKTDVRQGSKTHEYEPIAFKEIDLIKEPEILRARELGTMNNTIDLSREIARISKNRFDKTEARKEKLRWDTLGGAIAISENGVVVNETFPVQSHNPLVDWDDLATATPLRDLNAMKLKFRGTGASASGAKLYMNQTTTNWLLENQNAADLKGFQNSNFAHLPYSTDEINKILSARGLPEIVVYDEGYIDESDNFVQFLGDGAVRLVGKRPAGQTVGDWLSTPSLHRYNKSGQAMPGYFSFVLVNGKSADEVGSISVQHIGQAANPKIEVVGGEYGGTRLIYPKSVIKMQAAS